MYKYLGLNLVVLSAVVIILLIRRPRLNLKRLGIVFGIVVLLTAIFDSLIVGLDIVGYNYQYLTGLFVGRAPIEDFFYTIVAVVFTISLWQGKSNE